MVQAFLVFACHEWAAIILSVMVYISLNKGGITGESHGWTNDHS